MKVENEIASLSLKYVSKQKYEATNRQNKYEFVYFEK